MGYGGATRGVIRESSGGSATLNNSLPGDEKICFSSIDAVYLFCGSARGWPLVPGNRPNAEGNRQRIETVTIKFNIGTYYTERDFYIGDHLIAERPSRDAAVRLGKNVAIVEGAFPSWGGSSDNPRLYTPVKRWTGGAPQLAVTLWVWGLSQAEAETMVEEYDAVIVSHDDVRPSNDDVKPDPAKIQLGARK